MMKQAFICSPVRTGIGRFGGTLAAVRADDLAAIPLKALIARNQRVDWERVDDVILGNANQAGECNRNIARMATLLAGLPETVPGTTLNRLCGSGMDTIGTAARAIRAGEADLMIAGGAESMSRAPFVMAKAQTAWSRQAEVYDTTMGWRFPNPVMKKLFGTESMPETAENVAEDFAVSRADQDAFALRSQSRAGAAQASGRFDREIVPVTIPQRKKDDIVFARDEHIRADTKLESLANLPTPFREGGSITAGNASGINDGACAMLVASEEAARQFHLEPLARVVAMACAGLAPRIMGFGPVAATSKVMRMTGLSLADMDVIELNEAFAAQALAVMRDWGIADDASHVNANGGAIALGHPLAMSGARLVTTASYQLQQTQGQYALCTMCIGVGQGIAMVLERV